MEVVDLARQYTDGLNENGGCLLPTNNNTAKYN